MNKGLLIILAVLLVVLILLNLERIILSKESQIASQNQNNNIKNSEIQDCSIRIEEMIVRGNSLDPLIKPEQAIKTLFGYYNCHEVEFLPIQS